MLIICSQMFEMVSSLPLFKNSPDHHLSPQSYVIKIENITVSFYQDAYNPTSLFTSDRQHRHFLWPCRALYSSINAGSRIPALIHSEANTQVLLAMLMYNIYHHLSQCLLIPVLIPAINITNGETQFHYRTPPGILYVAIGN